MESYEIHKILWSPAKSKNPKEIVDSVALLLAVGLAEDLQRAANVVGVHHDIGAVPGEKFDLLDRGPRRRGRAHGPLSDTNTMILDLPRVCSTRSYRSRRVGSKL